MTTTRVLLIAPALSAALREARFGEPAGAGGVDGVNEVDGVGPNSGPNSDADAGPAGGTDRASAGTDGSTDGSTEHDGLDPVGLRQAEAVRETFPRTSRIYASPSRRCRGTARALGLDAEPLTGLAPCAMGRWQGRTLDDVAAAEPESVAAWLADPAAAPHGGESLLALLTRVGRWLDALPGDSDRGGSVLAVAEPDIVRAAAVHALGAPPQAFWRIDVRPLSVTELSGRGGRWNLLGGRPPHTGRREEPPSPEAD